MSEKKPDTGRPTVYAVKSLNLRYHDKVIQCCQQKIRNILAIVQFGRD